MISGFGFIDVSLDSSYSFCWSIFRCSWTMP